MWACLLLDGIGWIMVGKSFRELALLCESLEKVALTGQVQSLTFRNHDRQLVGSLILDGGLVRFGVHVEGRPYTDEILLQRPAAALHAPLLAKLLARTPLTEEEHRRLLSTPLRVQRSQRDLTARALRRLAALCDLTQLRAFTISPSRQPSSVGLHHAFRPVELLLAAGSSGSIRYTDPAARYYELPPPLAEDRWLFEWQAAESSWPWPVLAPGLTERTSETVAQLSQVGLRLAEYLRFIQSRREYGGLSAAIFSSEDHSYYVLSTQQYLTLLVYKAAQHESLIKSLQKVAAYDRAPHHSEVPSAETPSALSGESLVAESKNPPPARDPGSDPRGAEPTLKIDALTAWAGETMVLRDLNLRLGARGVYALLGAAGSGKSALLGILSGRNRSGSGWTLRGKILYQGASLGSAARPAVLGPRLARPAIRLRDYLLGDSDPESPEAYAQLCEQLERVRLLALSEHLNGVLGEGELRLSSGQWWRLALARELMADPPLVCVDDPTAELDAEEAELLLAVLRSVGSQRTVLLSTRHEQQARDGGDYLIRLVRGHIDPGPRGQVRTSAL